MKKPFIRGGGNKIQGREKWGRRKTDGERLSGKGEIDSREKQTYQNDVILVIPRLRLGLGSGLG